MQNHIFIKVRLKSIKQSYFYTFLLFLDCIFKIQLFSKFLLTCTIFVNSLYKKRETIIENYFRRENNEFKRI